MPKIVKNPVHKQKLQLLTTADDLDGDFVNITGDTMTGKLTISSGGLEVEGATIFNETGADVDFRIEGDTDTNLFFVDASTDRIGIGTNTPSTALEVAKGGIKSGNLIISGVPRSFAQPITIDGQNPPAFMYLDSTYNQLRIGIQGATYTGISFELPSGSGYQDAISISSTSFSPATAFNNVIALGTANQRWLSSYMSKLNLITGATGLGGYAIIGNKTEASGNYGGIQFAVSQYDYQYNKGGIYYVNNGSGYGRGTIVFAQHSGANATNALSTDIALSIANNSDVVSYGGAIINESGLDRDTRIEGDTQQNLFFVDASTDRIGIQTSAPSAVLDVGGFGSLIASLGAAMTVAGNNDSISGVQMYNASSGSNADFRFMVTDNAKDQYLAFAMPSTGNTAGALFGLTRSTSSFIFINSVGAGTDRALGIGTIHNTDLVLGTNTTERIKVGASGNGIVVNEGGLDYDFRVEGDTNANLLFIDASADKIGIGTAAPAEALEVVGTVRADGLRLDLTPTAETIVPTHTITISVNGTNYKLPIQAA